MRFFGSAVVLAGGKSSRMGFNKAFIKVHGKPIIEIILNRLATVFDDLIVVTNEPNKYKNLKARIVTDMIKGAGPLGGIHSGLKTAQSRYVFVMACDMPFISLKYIDYMKTIAAEYLPDAVISCKGNWVEPFHAFYSKNIIEDIETNIKDGSFKIFDTIKNECLIRIDEKKVREYSPNLDIFINLNNREELEKFYTITESAGGQDELFSGN